jgi:peptidoglycan hydrolase CwlO-like protein
MDSELFSKLSSIQNAHNTMSALLEKLTRSILYPGLRSLLDQENEQKALIAHYQSQLAEQRREIDLLQASRVPRKSEPYSLESILLVSKPTAPSRERKLIFQPK